jgi:trimethylamine--corrinoid protein Co-methyltransferase
MHADSLPNSGQSRRRRRSLDQPGSNKFAGSNPIKLPTYRLDVLSDRQLEQIHRASLKILGETGVVFNSPEALNLFRQASARVNDNRVFIGPDLLDHCLSTVPAEYTLHARNPANNVIIGGDHCAVMPGGGPPYVLDLEGTRRPGTLVDVENFARLSSMSPQINVVACKATEAQDIDPTLRHLLCWQAILTLTDKPGQSGFVGGRAEAEDVLQMLAIVFGGEDAIDGRPIAHCSVNANSPLQFDRSMLESLLLFASFGQPVLISSFVMAGVTGPITLAGSLALHNAEVLAGLTLTQLARPGTPVLYGTASSNADMRNAAPAIGSPESGVNIAACAQLARYYGVPARGGGALTDSPIPDAQSNYERMFTLLTSVLSGVNFLMHGLGILESYLTISYEQFVIDLELLEMIQDLVRPVEVSESTLALDTINQVGPGGHFLETDHTRQHYRHAHFLPNISIRRPYEQWMAEGATDAMRRANKRCRELLANYTKPAIDPILEARLATFIERRKLAIDKSRSVNR